MHTPQPFKVSGGKQLQGNYILGSLHSKFFFRRTGKKKLCKTKFRRTAFNLVKAFHKNSLFLQYQMDECHKLLTNKVDLSNPEGHRILRNIHEPLPLRSTMSKDQMENMPFILYEYNKGMETIGSVRRMT
ncbi:hypothetical protein Tco_0965494 [Tanacetum coccineum]